MGFNVTKTLRFVDKSPTMTADGLDLMVDTDMVLLLSQYQNLTLNKEK